jgi:hypothetical protein
MTETDWREIARKWEKRARRWRHVAFQAREALLADDVETALLILEAQLFDAGVIDDLQP